MKKFANIFTITVLLFFVQFACQKAEIESSMVPENDDSVNQLSFQSEGSLLRNKLVEARKQGNLKKESPILDFQNGVELRKNARMEAADKGCGKFKTITTSFPKLGYDEINVIAYKANNLIDYIDYSYSDEPSSNGRLSFTYKSLGSVIELSYKYADGFVLENKDEIYLNPKGHAVVWFHDFSNYIYEKPYRENITYNSAGYPTAFENSIDEKITRTMTLQKVKYTSAMNIESISDGISGEVQTFTYDLTRPNKITLSYHPIYFDYSRLYGLDSPNNLIKKEVKDLSGKLIRTFEIQREYNADGYPTKVTRKIDGVAEEIFKDISYDCKNYNISQPRSYK
jgi:hypothetical protein